MYSKFVAQFCTLLFIMGLSSCKNYSVSLNDNLVYTPAAVFTNFTLADEHLRTCVAQTLSDKHITAAADLKQLNCSNAGITSLAGLETFTGIEQLNLSENGLTVVPQLAKLAQLRVLSLRKNNLTNAESLLHLLHLNSLDLSDNKMLKCNDLYQLIGNFQRGELTAILPEQCNK